MFALAWKVKSRIFLLLVPSSRTSKAANCSRSMHRWTTIFPAFLYPSSSVHGCTITVAEISRTVSFFDIFSFSRGRYFFRYMSITVTTIYKRFLAVEHICHCFVSSHMFPMCLLSEPAAFVETSL